MGWYYPSIEATCDRCGYSDSIEGDSMTSGHYCFPTNDEVGWGYGEEGDLCPECVAKDEAKDSQGDSCSAEAPCGWEHLCGLCETNHVCGTPCDAGKGGEDADV